VFTGIIEGIGTIAGIRSTGQGRCLTVEAGFTLDDVNTGDSISVNGACLTVVSVGRDRFSADVSPETLSKTALHRLRSGSRVNLEQALRYSDRLGGHLVSGHIDGVGKLSRRETAGNAILLEFEIAEMLSRYIIQKGSVAVDGVSLTVNRCDRHSFGVSIIPHTTKETTLEQLRLGDPVNIETDMIGKYVEHFLLYKEADGEGKSLARSEINLQFLAENGFLR